MPISGIESWGFDLAFPYKFKVQNGLFPEKHLKLVVPNFESGYVDSEICLLDLAQNKTNLSLKFGTLVDLGDIYTWYFFLDFWKPKCADFQILKYRGSKWTFRGKKAPTALVMRVERWSRWPVLRTWEESPHAGLLPWLYPCISTDYRISPLTGLGPTHKSRPIRYRLAARANVARFYLFTP